MRRTADTGTGGTGGGFGGDAYPGEEPDAEAEARDYSESMAMGQLDDPREYRWSMTGTHISVSDDYDHGSLFEGMGHMDWSQPHAWGTVEVSYRWEARWTIEGSSMALHTVEQRLKRYSRDQGWKHVTILDDSGMESKVGARTADYTGVGDGNYPAQDWQTHDEVGEVDPGNFAGFGDPTDDEKPSGPMVCSTCGEPFPTYDDWAKHVDQVHRNPDREPDPAPQPVVDLDQPNPAGFNTFNTGDETIMRQIGKTMRERYAAGKELINGPVPFVYDIENDRIHVGHPGGRHAEIKGQFTPGGVVEGLYLPDGKMQFRTDTDMPYTIRHMIQLWYAMHPELEVKSVYKLEDGKPYKLASSNIVWKVRNLVDTDEAAREATAALVQRGANVYVVGDAIRDVVRGSVPSHFELLVEGLSAPNVAGILETLPGSLIKEAESLTYLSVDGSNTTLTIPQKGGVDPVSPEVPSLLRQERLAAVCLNTAELLDPAERIQEFKKAEERVATVKERPSLKVVRESNILDPVKDTLDPAIWDGAATSRPRIKPHVAKWIRDEVTRVMVADGWPDPSKYLSLVLTGSLTTYQWAEHSDCDISVWIDVERFPEFVRADLIATMIAHMDGTLVPGTHHPLQCFVVNVEKFKPDDLYKPGLRSAYDLDKDRWIVPPDRSSAHDVAKEYPRSLGYARLFTDKLKLMMKYDPAMVKPLWHSLHKQRMHDQSAGLGDFSPSNIVYKFISNAGLFPEISRLTGEYIASAPSLRVSFIREADWVDVADKAKRLVMDGNVTVMTNRPNYVGAIVKGDHGTYQTEISRHDPDSQVIEQWGCTCPWSQYAFDRTRKWKKLEGRPCSHVMAVYWKAKSTPLDVTDMDQGYQVPRGQMKSPAGPGQMELPAPLLPTAPPAEQVDMVPPVSDEQQGQIEQPAGVPTDQNLGIPQQPMWAPQQPGQRQGPQRGPQQQPMRQQLTLWDVTVPQGVTGQPIPPGQIPTVLFPGALSKVYAVESSDWIRYSKSAIEEWAQELLSRGRIPAVQVVHPNVHLEQRGGKIPAPGSEPVGWTQDGLPQYRTSDLGWDPVLQRRVRADEGTAGAPEQRGVFSPVKPGMRAELRAVEPLLGMAYVVVPMRDSGPLHPHALEGWVDYGDLVPTTNQQTPFRARVAA